MPTDILRFYPINPAEGFSHLVAELSRGEDDPAEKLWPEFFQGEEVYVYHHSHRLSSIFLEDMARRLKRSWTSELREAELRAYSVPLAESFKSAAREYPSITIDPNVMAGAPCIAGTRIPVYMVLDAVEYYGTIEGALSSYPGLTAQQVKDAIGFSKLVVECPIDNEATVTGR